MNPSGRHTPRRWAEATVASERPAIMPPDPAIVSEQRFEREFVREKRAARVSWFNIAKMTGKTVPYLQGVYGGPGK